MKCVYCKKVTAIIIGDETEDEYVCSECLERDFTSCSDCGVWVHNDTIRTVRRYSDGSEMYVCEHCCDNSYTKCVECGEYFKNNEGTDDTFDGDWRCYGCLDDSGSFIQCEGCDTYYREGDMPYSESWEGFFCPMCYEEDESVNKK